MLIHIKLTDEAFGQVQAMKEREHLQELSPQEYLQKKVDDFLTQNSEKKEGER